MQPLTHIRKFDKKLGVGAYGVVYLGFDDEQGRFVAIKEIPYCGGGGESASSAANQILQEMRVMQRFCQHDNLVGYYGARRSPVGVQLIMEYLGGGSLERLLRHSGRLPELIVRRYTRDILRGLRCLHEDMRVCHRDVKPANVLLTPEGCCKLTDFGVSKLLMTAVPKNAGSKPQRRPSGMANALVHDDEEDYGGEEDSVELLEDPFMQTTVGTPWYMAPEVISGGEPTEGHDTDNTHKDGDAHNCDDGTNGRGNQDYGHDGEEDDLDGSLYYNPLRGIAFRGDGKETGPHSPHGVFLSQLERKMHAHGYTTSADIWSLGVTVYEMICGQKPFGAGLVHPTAVLFRIINSASQPPRLPDGVRQSVSHELRNFLDLCFVYDKALRPSAAELLDHPWLQAHKDTRATTAALGPRRAEPSPLPSQPMAPLEVRNGSRVDSGSGSGSGHSAAGTPKPLLCSVFSPMLDAADLPPASTASVATVPGPAQPLPAGHPSAHPPAFPRRSSSPRSSSCSTSSAPSPTVADRRRSGLLRPEPASSSSPYAVACTAPAAPAAAVAAARKRELAMLSLPPELPTLPSNNVHGACSSVRLQPQPSQQQPQKQGRKPSVSATGSDGFFSKDGHYVDFIARLPSPRNS